MENQNLSVSEFVALVNQTLVAVYPQVVVEGEVSNFKVSQGKWVHFDLKDAEATVNCFMTVYQLKQPLEDGMNIRVTASPSLKKWGRFSLTVRAVELAGEGELMRAFELLRAQLEQEGLFAPERKRPIPEYPRRIAVVSSKDAAGYQDFIEILNQRWGGVAVQLANVQVQGEPAPDQITAAIQYLNQETPLADALVIIRGGGSLEDLQAFNTEPVVRAIAASRIPTIVGVGHEQDVSLADMAADLRAATPTDAARRVVPDKREAVSQLTHQQNHLYNLVLRRIHTQDSRLQQASQRLERLLYLPQAKVEELAQRLPVLLSGRLEGLGHRLDGLGRVLKNLDPKRVLERGYAIARIGGTVIRSAQEAKIGDALVVQLAKGQLNTEVKHAKK